MCGFPMISCPNPWHFCQGQICFMTKKGTYHTGYRLPCRFKRRMRCFHPGADLDDLIQFCGPGLDGKVLQPNHGWKSKTLGLTSSMRLLVNVRLFENWIKSEPIRKRCRWWLIPHSTVGFIFWWSLLIPYDFWSLLINPYVVFIFP